MPHLIPPAARHLSRERVQDIVDGAAPWLDEAVHLMWCARCAEELQSYERVVRLVRNLVRADLPTPCPRPPDGVRPDGA